MQNSTPPGGEGTPPEEPFSLFGTPPPPAKAAAAKKPRGKGLLLLLALLNLAALCGLCACLLQGRSTGTDGKAGGQAATEPNAQNAAAEWSVSPFSPQAVFADGELAAALPIPAAGYAAMMQEAFYPLYAQNNDFAGWLTIPGTSVDFPVYQAADNDKYLRADSYLAYDRRGSVFMDYRCHYGLSRAQFSACTILYGHHLRSDASLFAELENYLDIGYYTDHPLVEFDTLYGSYTWLVAGCFLVNVEPADDNGNVFYYLYTDFASDEDFLTFAQEIDERSWIRNPAVTVEPGDKLLLLSTCTYKMTVETEARCVLVCRLARPEEATGVDTSRAYQNEAPRLPQVWYDQYADGVNPWADDPVWNISDHTSND